jgi:hypothetical protein
LILNNLDNKNEASFFEPAKIVISRELNKSGIQIYASHGFRGG